MQLNWSAIEDSFEVADEIAPYWLKVCDSVGGASHIKIEASGKWRLANGILPGWDLDGATSISLPGDQLVVPNCPFGALIGKVGGSSAGHRKPESPGDTPAIDEPFAVGTFCVLKIPENTFGPLFVGMNSVLRPVSVETPLKISVSGAWSKS